MAGFSIEDMQKLQMELQKKYKDKWQPICAETGQNKLLWLIGEVGEVIDIIKKNDTNAVMTCPNIRENLIEELADILMYYNDVLLCYNVSEEELKEAYVAKFKKNMNRW